MAAKKPAIAKIAKNSNRGSKPGERRGGRKKGTQNKKNAAVIAAVEESGITPLDYMLNVMRAPIPEGVEPEVKVAMIGQRFEAAKAAAPYVHPRLTAVEHTGKGGEAIDMVWTVKIIDPKKRA